jgi:gliding motility-associated-like protein
MKHKILLLLLFTIIFCFAHPVITVAQSNPSNQNKDAVFSFYIPNAFTPNDDGINDEFYGKGEGILKYDMWVFDRWGNLIFHSKELNEGWNGKSNDESDVVQQDVYIWKVILTDVFNKKHDYIGTVTLVR